MANTRRNPEEILGNTNPKSHREQQKKMWCFTFNNYSDGLVSKLNLTLNTLGKYIYGFEVGESGTPHLQGFINFNVKKSLSCIIKAVGIPTIHWEACKGSQKDNETYCTKGGNWKSNYFEEVEELEILDESLFYDWQKDIISLVSTKADKRKVNWYWEPDGGIGKSSFCKYLCFHYKATYLDEGKKSDIINMIYNLKDINSRSVIVIDVPRDNGNKVSYKAIEQIKNGMICNTKFETGMKLFNSPHLIIFANQPPDESKMSADRWNIVRVDTLKEMNGYVSPLDL